MSKTRKVVDTCWGDQEFLNPIGSSECGAIQAKVKVSVERDDKDIKRASIDADLAINDCSRFITLEFSEYWDSYMKGEVNLEPFKERIHKINRLIKVLKGFKKEYEKAYKAIKDQVEL